MRVGDTLFVHAGVLPHHVDYGLERINSEAKAWVAHTPGEEGEVGEREREREKKERIGRIRK